MAQIEIAGLREGAAAQDHRVRKPPSIKTYFAIARNEEKTVRRGQRQVLDAILEHTQGDKARGKVEERQFPVQADQIPGGAKRFHGAVLQRRDQRQETRDFRLRGLEKERVPPEIERRRQRVAAEAAALDEVEIEQEGRLGAVRAGDGFRL